MNDSGSAGVTISAEQWAEVQAMLDRDAIRQRLGFLTRGSDRVFGDLLADSYWPESWDFHGAFSGTGYQFAKDSEPARLRSTDVNVVTHHMLGQSNIELYGDEAHVETYMLAVAVRGGETPHRKFEFTGRYLDRFKKIDGEWRIQVRRVVLDTSTEYDHTELWASDGAYPHGKRYPDDGVFHFDEFVSLPTS